MTFIQSSLIIHGSNPCFIYEDEKYRTTSSFACIVLVEYFWRQSDYCCAIELYSPRSILKAGVKVNLSEIWVSLKRG